MSEPRYSQQLSRQDLELLDGPPAASSSPETRLKYDRKQAAKIERQLNRWLTILAIAVCCLGAAVLTLLIATILHAT
jgi:hypothetical protein